MIKRGCIVAKIKPGVAGKGDESASAADAAILAQLSSKNDAKRYCEYAVGRVDRRAGRSGELRRSAG